MLALSSAESTVVNVSWVIVIFNPSGMPVTRVDYWPRCRNGVVHDVAYVDASAKLDGHDSVSLP